MSNDPSRLELQAENARLRRALEQLKGQGAVTGFGGQSGGGPEGGSSGEARRDRQWMIQVLERVLEAAAVPTFVKDRAHRWIVLNKACCEFLGFSKEQLLGKDDYEVFPREQADVSWRMDEAVFTSRLEGTSDTQVVDAAGNGHLLPIRRVLVEDGDGSLLLVGSILGTAERLLGDRRLHDNLGYLNCIIENLPMCVKLVDAKGTILDINPAGCAMMGAASKDQIAGHNMDDALLESEKEGYHRFNEGVCRGQGGTHQYRVKGLAGGVLTLSSLSVPIPSSDGSGFIQLAITRDLTEELKREAETLSLQNQLQQAHKLEAVGTLAGGIAHDFNNILGAILGYSELVLQNLTEPRMRREMEQVIGAALRAKDLVKQILTFSRLRQGELRPQRIQPVVHEAIRLLRASLPASIGIVEQVDSECGPVLADAGQIHQILMNLCTNAYYAMKGKGGVLRVSMHPLAGPPPLELGLASGPFIAIEVEDTGSGMTQEVMDRIFEPYFTTKGKDEGTGLGLSVVHGIVRGHGGAIQVRSTPGVGSMFTVMLPQADRLADSQGEPAREELPNGNEHILLVDDEEALVAGIAQNLARFGYVVTALTSSEAALKAFLEDPERFDLIITDLRMPKLTGLELAREVLGHRPSLPVILCTGCPEANTYQTAKGLGIRDVLTKPLLTIDLAKAIRRLLD